MLKRLRKLWWKLGPRCGECGAWWIQSDIMGNWPACACAERPRMTVALADEWELTPKEVLNALTSLNQRSNLHFQAVHDAMDLALDQLRFKD